MTKEKLREERLKIGLTQAEMAAALNTPYGTYQKWELGRRRVPGMVWVAIECLREKGRIEK